MILFLKILYHCFDITVGRNWFVEGALYKHKCILFVWNPLILCSVWVKKFA